MVKKSLILKGPPTPLLHLNPNSMEIILESQGKKRSLKQIKKFQVSSKEKKNNKLKLFKKIAKKTIQSK